MFKPGDKIIVLDIELNRKHNFHRKRIGKVLTTACFSIVGLQEFVHTLEDGETMGFLTERFGLYSPKDTTPNFFA